MNIHEYQSKAILKSYGVAVPAGKPAFTIDEAVAVAAELTAPIVVVKAQIHAGGRGKAGGVKLAHSVDEVKSFAADLLGKVLVTHQTGAAGKRVNRLLIEEGSSIAKEYYLSITIDRSNGAAVMIGSAEGGVDIESVAATSPEKIHREIIDPLIGLAPFQANRMAFAMNFSPSTHRKAADLMMKLYRAFVENDCSLAEINPLVVTTADDVIALDAKLNFDDSALFRHPDIEALRDDTEEDPKERRAAKADLNYVNLGGNVACMVNGAGLAMATVDILKFYGGEPANFLDVGGDSTPEKIAEAFNIMLDAGQAKGIFVNIFGGINKCDLVAQGIIDAARLISGDSNQMPVPVVVRLEGTNADIGRKMLSETPIGNVIMAPSMEQGAAKIVALVNQN